MIRVPKQTCIYTSTLHFQYLYISLLLGTKLLMLKDIPNNNYVNTTQCISLLHFNLH